MVNIAIVTDDLIQRGGQELLVSALSAIWPQAPVYTCFASDYWKRYYSDKSIKLITSNGIKLPFFGKLSRYYFLFLSHIRAYENFDFSGYDIVLSVTSRYAHFILTKPQTTHIAYVNSPGRMFWEPTDYFENESFGLLKLFGFYLKKLLLIPLQLNRIESFISFRRPDLLIANSKSIQAKIKKYINRTSTVIYPFFESSSVPMVETSSDKNTGYYLIITRLAFWKHVEIAVQACTELNIKLIVIGRGPQLSFLKSIAGSCVTILDDVQDPQKLDLLKNCKALIHTQNEDFGIVPLEAMSFGKPVLAYGKGGALETIIDGETGAFFNEQTADSLKQALQHFDPSKYSSQKCILRAKDFAKENFVARMRKFVEDALYGNHIV